MFMDQKGFFESPVDPLCFNNQDDCETQVENWRKEFDKIMLDNNISLC